MSALLRSVANLTVAVVVCGLFFFLQPGSNVCGQNQPKPISTSASDLSAVTPVQNSAYDSILRVACECFLDEDWEEGIKALQFLLECPDDSLSKQFFNDPFTKKNYQLSAGFKYEARRLLGNLPAKGLKIYELGYGESAWDLYDKASINDKYEVQKLTELVHRYPLTERGMFANQYLGHYYLSQNCPGLAAYYFDLLHLHGKHHEIAYLNSAMAALAHKRAGHNVRFEHLWQQKLKSNKHFKNFAELEKQLDQILFAFASVVPGLPDQKDRKVRNEQPVSIGKRLWSRKTVNDPNRITGSFDPSKKAEEVLDDALKMAKKVPGTPILNGFVPVVTRGKAIFRTHCGLTSVLTEDLTDGKGNVIAKAGELDWKTFHSPVSIGELLSRSPSRSERGIRAKATAWLQEYKNRFPGSTRFLYENSLIGSLSADDQNVYLIDDLSVPIPPHFIRNDQDWDNKLIVPTLLKGFVLKNNLMSFDIRTGRVKWMRGNTYQPAAFKPAKAFKIDKDFDNSFFLGTPLSIQGKLYVLNENKDGAIRLATLDPKTGNLLGPMQPLGKVKSHARIARDPLRRTHGVYLTFADGILVCPTNAGHIFGYDPFAKAIAWTYPYREKEIGVNKINPLNPPNPFADATWNSAPPVISAGKLVFTAPDAHSLHCLNLKTGMLLWKKSKAKDDLFLAGVRKDTVLIVAKNSFRAHRLSDGKQLWTVATKSLPSGKGMTVGDLYYLPLETGEIVAVNLNKGNIQSRSRPSLAKNSRLGNLLFYHGGVLSQSPKTVQAFQCSPTKQDLKKNDK